jgi:hypothetical protein
LPRFNSYVAGRRLPYETPPPRIVLNRYPGVVIGIEVGVFGRRWGMRWKRS